MSVHPKYIRCFAIAQTCLGCLLVIFGTADRATMFHSRTALGAIHTASMVAVWTGVWIVVTGVIGIFATSHKYANPQNNRTCRSAALNGTYVGFSVTSVVLVSLILLFYGAGVSWFNSCSYQSESRTRECNTSVALGCIVIIFAILEFGCALMACICSCINGVCDCCGMSPSPPNQTPDQVIYIQNSPGVMIPGGDGVPVVVPVDDVQIQKQTTIDT